MLFSSVCRFLATFLSYLSTLSNSSFGISAFCSYSSDCATSLSLWHFEINFLALVIPECRSSNLKFALWIISLTCFSSFECSPITSSFFIHSFLKSQHNLQIADWQRESASSAFSSPWTQLMLLKCSCSSWPLLLSLMKLAALIMIFWNYFWTWSKAACSNLLLSTLVFCSALLSSCWFYLSWRWMSCWSMSASACHRTFSISSLGLFPVATRRAL